MSAPAHENLIIRPARPDERLRLIELQRRASLANPSDREMLLAHPEAVDTPEAQFAAGNVLLAGRDQTILGFAAIEPREDGNAELDGLFVEPKFWKSGIGRALVEAAADRALALGDSKLHVVGNPHAEQFYLRLGFVQTGHFETRFGTGLLMVRALA